MLSMIDRNKYRMILEIVGTTDPAGAVGFDGK